MQALVRKFEGTQLWIARNFVQFALLLGWQ